MTDVTVSGGPTAPLGRVTVIGTGLIGTSIGLALSARGVEVRLDDIDPSVAKRAADRGAGSVWRGGDAPADLAVICTPPAAIASQLKRAQDLDLAASFTDVGGVKASLLAQAETVGCDMTTITGGHPFAGRERGGPESGDGELFTDRPWVLCPTTDTSAASLLAARQLAEACGAVAVVTSPERHDAAAAWLSHLPQLLASALAAGASEIGERELGLAGQGFRDLTRIADSPPGLWQDVVALNIAEVSKALQLLQQQLAPLLAASSDGDRAGEAAASLVKAGNRGRALLPIKAGRVTAGATVVVAVSDRPGELARLLADAAAAHINIEDVHVQHGAAAARGLVDLDVARHDESRLVAELRRADWHCWAPRRAAD